MRLKTGLNGLDGQRSPDDSSDSLVLRPWAESDADALATAITDSIEHLRPFLPWIAHEPLSLTDRRAMIAGWATDVQNGGDQIFGAFIGTRIVGGCGLHHRLGAGGLEIGYWVHKDHVRRGIATAMARALTEAAFADPEIERVEIHHDAANVASGGVPKGLGYRLVSTEPRPIAAPGETGVHLIWRFTRAEWAQSGP